MENWTKEELRKEIARYEKRLAYLENIAGQCDVEDDIQECRETLRCLREKYNNYKETINA